MRIIILLARLLVAPTLFLLFSSLDYDPLHIKFLPFESKPEISFPNNQLLSQIQKIGQGKVNSSNFR